MSDSEEEYEADKDEGDESDDDSDFDAEEELLAGPVSGKRKPPAVRRCIQADPGLKVPGFKV